MLKIGICRIRNEENIIKNTLDHVSTLVDEVIIYDDASTDRTVEICKAHPVVSKVIEGKVWNPTPQGRELAEGNLRQIPYLEAMKKNPDWIYYFDADEYADFSLVEWDNPNIHGYELRLFDFYITQSDIDDNYLDREFMGPEYRDILMLFRPNTKTGFRQRIPYGVPRQYKIGGYVKHYGKAISVEEWDSTCLYYINHRGKDFIPMFTEKWKARIGKAIHTKSDFGFPLIKWSDRKSNAVFDLNKRTK